MACLRAFWQGDEEKRKGGSVRIRWAVNLPASRPSSDRHVKPLPQAHLKSTFSLSRWMPVVLFSIGGGHYQYRFTDLVIFFLFSTND